MAINNKKPSASSDNSPFYCRYKPDVVCQLAVEAHKHETRYKSILEYSFEEIYIFDAETLHFVEVSNGATANLGYTINELKNMTPTDIKPMLSESVFKSILKPLINGEEQVARFSTVHRRNDGSQYDIDVRLQYVDGDEPVFVSMVTDVTERNKYEDELKNLAFRDAGTDLYNRRYFVEQLEGTINHINRMCSSVGLILIDMDDFSKVNNEYGHLAGDKIIANFADKINDVFSRKTDVVARYGGDEFVVMCIENTENDLITKCLELRDLFNIPYIYEGNEITQTASMGICVKSATKGLVTSEALFRGADEAMYVVKAKGKNSVRVCGE
jgi:diguanylate cyclase (GGDEF)-like protein/PAS domain S-box-containing protein